MRTKLRPHKPRSLININIRVIPISRPIGRGSNKRKLRMELEQKAAELAAIDRSLTERTRDLDRLLEEEAYLKLNREGADKSLRQIRDAIFINDATVI